MTHYARQKVHDVSIEKRADIIHQTAIEILGEDMVGGDTFDGICNLLNDVI